MPRIIQIAKQIGTVAHKKVWAGTRIGKGEGCGFPLIQSDGLHHDRTGQRRKKQAGSAARRRERNIHPGVDGTCGNTSLISRRIVCDIHGAIGNLGRTLDDAYIPLRLAGSAIHRDGLGADQAHLNHFNGNDGVSRREVEKERVGPLNDCVSQVPGQRIKRHTLQRHRAEKGIAAGTKKTRGDRGNLIEAE